MIGTIQCLPRHQIDTSAWDCCVAASPQRILYAYAWYLDAVLPAPNWKWTGLVMPDSVCGYQAVMPVPLRRKFGRWVVHQPLFCQFLGVFCRDTSLTAPFFALLWQRYRYGSTLSVRQEPPDAMINGQRRSTHTLDLSPAYQTISRHYTADRRANLRQGQLTGWLLEESTDVEPVINLFRQHHADAIDGGVADWAYTIFRNLAAELAIRGFITVRYASLGGQTEAGVVFVQEGNRIIYLFNAASDLGRRGNARTVLIDQLIRERAGGSLIFDFESPDKPSIRAFYESFDAREDPFWTTGWSRLNWVERLAKKTRKLLLNSGN